MLISDLSPEQWNISFKSSINVSKFIRNNKPKTTTFDIDIKTFLLNHNGTYPPCASPGTKITLQGSPRSIPSSLSTSTWSKYILSLITTLVILSSHSDSWELTWNTLRQNYLWVGDPKRLMSYLIFGCVVVHLIYIIHRFYKL